MPTVNPHPPYFFIYALTEICSCLCFSLESGRLSRCQAVLDTPTNDSALAKGFPSSGMGEWWRIHAVVQELCVCACNYLALAQSTHHLLPGALGHPPLSRPLQVCATTLCSTRFGPCMRDIWTCGRVPAHGTTTSTSGYSFSVK